MLFLMLLAITPPPPPSPQATRDVAVCRIELELPRGSIVVGKVCRVNGTSARCDGEEVITVSDEPAFAEDTPAGARGLLLRPRPYSVREERYAAETRYLLVPADRPAKRHPYLSLVEPVPLQVETRACPDTALYLEKGQDIVLFASSSGTAKLGESLRSFTESNGPGPWIVVVFGRMK
jgi:hypothetical protein